MIAGEAALRSASAAEVTSGAAAMQSPRVPRSSLKEVQGRGSQPPLYLVHGVGGGMTWGYENLARHLGQEQPVFVFQSRGLAGLPEWPTIEQMAASYVADLRAHQPHGPYLLGGYCFGGIVAYEMARLLEAQQQTVALLGLINCPPPNTNYERPRERGTPRWWLKFAGNLLMWGAGFVFTWTLAERSEFVRWKLRVLRKKFLAPKPGDATTGALNNLNELLGMADYSAVQRKLWETHMHAMRGYHPKTYGGDVTLFRTRGHPLLTSFDPHYGWRELAREVTTKVMPGAHSNILDEPHVRATARAFAASIRDAAEKTGRVR